MKTPGSGPPRQAGKAEQKWPVGPGSSYLPPWPDSLNLLQNVPTGVPTLLPPGVQPKGEVSKEKRRRECAAGRGGRAVAAKQCGARGAASRGLSGPGLADAARERAVEAPGSASPGQLDREPRGRKTRGDGQVGAQWDREERRRGRLGAGRAVGRPGAAGSLSGGGQGRPDAQLLTRFQGRSAAWAETRGAAQRSGTRGPGPRSGAEPLRPIRGRVLGWTVPGLCARPVPANPKSPLARLDPPLQAPLGSSEVPPAPLNPARPCWADPRASIFPAPRRTRPPVSPFFLRRSLSLRGYRRVPPFPSLNLLCSS